jgi:hypothetical protein
MAMTFDYWRNGEPASVAQPTALADYWRNGEPGEFFYTAGGGGAPDDPDPVPAIINIPQLF